MRDLLTVIQARTGSSRLPGKVLLPLGDDSVLGQMLIRVKAAKLAGQIVVAITEEPGDDPLVELSQRYGVACIRGDSQDLIVRHLKALDAFPARAVVKIPSDCPLIDPAIIDRVLGYHLAHEGQFDYVSNLHPQSYPDGNDVEVMTAEALKTAHREATRTIDREHTTPFLWDHPERFRIGNVLAEDGNDLSQDFRWTLDYREDYELIRAIFDSLSPEKPLFTVDDIVALVRQRPDIRRLNAARLGDAWYQRHKEELNTTL
jgi:spore coat polysaccharide biosynthesis protein SpsF